MIPNPGRFGTRPWPCYDSSSRVESCGRVSFPRSVRAVRDGVRGRAHAVGGRQVILANRAKIGSQVG